MGIEGLLQVLKPVTTKTHIRNFSNKTAAIDASCWLYKGTYSCSWDLSQGVKTYDYLHFMYHMIKVLQSYSITPIFVFDGLTLPLKKKTVEKRIQGKQTNKKVAENFLSKGNEESAKIMYSRCMLITREMIFTTIDLLHYMNIKYVVAPYEADVQLAYFCKKRIADFVISEDSDILVYGCENLVLKLDSEGNCENITLRKTLTDQKFLSTNQDKFIKDITNFSHSKFVELCILAGCDYLKNIPGIGLKRAIKFLKNSTLEEALDKISDHNSYIVPEDYLESVERVKLQFYYGWVIDMDSMKMVRFSPMYESMETIGLGDKLDDDIVKDHAIGLYDTKNSRRRERFNIEHLEQIRKELENFKRDKDLQEIKAEPVTSTNNIYLIQKCSFEESKELVIRKFREQENKSTGDEIIKARKRKAKEVIKNDTIEEQKVTKLHDLYSVPALILNKPKETLNEAKKDLEYKSREFVVNKNQRKLNKKNTSESNIDFKKAKEITRDDIRLARCKYFESNINKPKEEVVVINEEPTEVVLVEDDDSEIYMQKMSDIMAEGIKKLDKFYEY